MGSKISASLSPPPHHLLDLWLSSQIQSDLLAVVTPSYRAYDQNTVVLVRVKYELLFFSAFLPIYHNALTEGTN